MNKYRISRLYIKNFKLIKEASINFEADDIVVLDGPNGFGKTTIFDAIELIVTGSVSRIKEDDGRRSYRDILFCKNGNSTDETLVKAEFKNDANQRVIIAKSLPSQSDIPLNQRRPSNFSMFNTHVLTDFDEELSPKNQKVQADIEEIFGLPDIHKLYNLYYYIQQEESKRYLKGSEKSRREEISHLFNTKEEKKQLEGIKEVVKLLNKEKRNLTLRIDNLKTHLKDIKLEEMSISELEYQPLVSDNVLANWDAKDLSITNEEQRNIFVKELINLRDFILEIEEFKKAKYNRGIDAILKNEQIIADTLIVGAFLSEYKDIERKYNKQLKIKHFIELINHRDKLLELENKEFVELEQLLEIEFDVQKIFSNINIINKLQRDNSGFSDIVLDLDEIRQNLLDKFKIYLSYEENESHECPFCGKEWEDKQTLFNNIENKRLKYINKFDHNANKINLHSQELLKVYKGEVIEKINKSLSKENEKIKESFYEQLKDAIKNHQMIIKFIDWCEINNIEIRDFMNENINDLLSEADIHERVQQVLNIIRGLKYELAWSIEDYNEKYDKFNFIYNDLFKDKEELINKVTIDKINRKIQYIDNCYKNAIYRKKKDIEKNIEKESKKLDCITEEFKKATKAAYIFRTSIEEYELKVINDIEILFYIYSGRLLQYYQRGMGLFIQNTTGGLKFVSNANTDHDAINYLSSGQLSALVMSFTFTLNKIYSDNNLGILLIDDPVQTMDDINMASFVELLRNELTSRQIVLSTHEDNISRYVRYKFSTYGLKHQRFNVKENL
ncbi:AAA family ATPase (plasmid) [Bacillus wiedmannii]|uniref:AAA family ATPase n=1 Tax=Bacillus wiedmannii TaxID=1890302 RepID=UPI002882E399|nr:AAA family ATPase [Bacillus wiedmannii]WMS85104.1 AAA family ATPase [Bacillus wiedmannii]